MPQSNEPLKEHEVGSFGDLSKRPNPLGLVILQVPPFEAMLPFLEQKAGRRFTTQEVEVERAKAPCMVVSVEAAKKMAAARAARQSGPAH